jgi:hypothetical protein
VLTRCLLLSSKVLIALFGAIWVHAVQALETQVFDVHCRVEGLTRPLRQTVVIIDQSAIEARTGDVGEVNRRWINKVLTIAGVQEGQTSSPAAPRERISVVVAREDGTDLIRVFSGCSPTYSQAEIAELKRANSGLAGHFKWFFGKDIEHRLESDRKAFRSKLTSGLADLPKSGASKKNIEVGFAGTSFLQTLALLSGTFDLNEGLPRLVIISPMRLPFLKTIDDAKSARALGFEMAEKLGADLQRAEVYLTGLESEASRFVREFGNAFFLGIKGRFVAGTGETLPAFLDPPEKLRVYSGFIDYAGVQVPMQIRYAIDRSGSLVNSWSEVAVKKAVATPLSGKAVCKADDPDNCEVKGDGKEFAQVWSPEITNEPKFSEALPFSGVRYFEFSTTRTGLTGRVYDPLVIINGKKELPFQLSLTPNVRF